MSSKLSISRAWDETRSRIAADGRLYVTVALALIALPAAIGQFVTASGQVARTPTSMGEALLMIAVWLIGLVGQLALLRLALGTSVSVGESIAHGARRAPAYFGAVILIIVAIALVTIPFLIVLAAMGVTIDPQAAAPPAVIVLFLLYVAIVLYFAVRMLMSSPVASAEAVGPFGIIKRSWQLTKGHVLRLIGFLVLFLLAVLIVVGAVSLLANLSVGLIFGVVEPLSAGALIIALIEAFASAIATTVFVVMIARLYAQLSGDTLLEPSVPSSGT